MLLTLPVLDRMQQLEGWLTEPEADLLLAGAARALRDLPSVTAIVEIGSYVGRSTTVLASAAASIRTDARVFAIDPHDGVVSDSDVGFSSASMSTLEAFRSNIAAASLQDVVMTVPCRSWQVAWNRVIAFLYIDGLHDAENVARDFKHFEPWLAAGGYVAFHDYSNEWPAVTAFVDDLIITGSFEHLQTVDSMVLLRRHKTSLTLAAPGDAADTPAPTELLELAHLGALAAGQLLTSRAHQPRSILQKTRGADLVTDADIAAEKVIRETIHRHRPHDAILAEESGSHPGTTPVRWIVDPLDGTVNYLAGAAEWSISLAAEILGGGGGGGRCSSRARARSWMYVHRRPRSWRMVQRARFSCG